MKSKQKLTILSEIERINMKVLGSGYDSDYLKLPHVLVKTIKIKKSINKQ